MTNNSDADLEPCPDTLPAGDIDAVLDVCLGQELAQYAPVKECGCGLRYDAHAWKCLAYVGTSSDEEETLELRNCSCGSTLAIEVSK